MVDYGYPCTSEEIPGSKSHRISDQFLLLLAFLSQLSWDLKRSDGLLLFGALINNNFIKLGYIQCTNVPSVANLYIYLSDLDPRIRNPEFYIRIRL